MGIKTVRWLSLLVVVLVIISAGCVFLHSDQEGLPDVPEVVDFTPQQPESWTLSNGLQVLFVRDREVPLLQGTLYLRPGSLWENRFVAVDAMGRQMRLGGAGKNSATQLDHRLEVLAASISSSHGDEYGTVSFKALSEDVEEVLSLFSDVVRRPRFENERLRLWQGQALEAIARRVDSPDSVAEIAFNQLLYGDTPYGRVATSDDVKSLTRAELVKLHSRLVKPNNAILTVSGKISRSELERLIDLNFGSWEGGCENLPSPPSLSYQPRPGIYFIELPYGQATITMGQLGVARSSPQYVSFEVFSRVFGIGGFGSLLMERIRTDLGLAYSIHGLIAPGLVQGQNYVSLKTKSESVGQAITEVVRVIRELQDNLLPPNELEERKRAAENSFVFKLASSTAQVERKAILQVLGFPEDYDQRYLSKIRQVDSDTIQQIARQYWDPDQFVIVIVGNDKAYSSLVGSINSPAWMLAHSKVDKLRFGEQIIR